MKTNRDFYKDIRGSSVNYFLSDLHVHSPGSSDVMHGYRFTTLPERCRLALDPIPRKGLSALEHERRVRDVYPPSKFFEDLTKARDQLVQENGTADGLDWAVIGLTDHNVCTYSCEVSRCAWAERSSSRMHILPGLELDTTYQIGKDEQAVAHVICLFKPGLSESDIRVAINDSSGGNWEPGSGIVIEDLPSFIHELRNHGSYPSICIAAHVATQKGIHEGTKLAILSRLDAGIARVQQELEHGADPDTAVLKRQLESLEKQRKDDDEISLSCLKLIGDCGFDALQIASEDDEVHYRYLHRFKPDYGRAVPIIASDAHSANEIFRCENGTPYLKLTTASSHVNEKEVFEDVRNALRLGETRFSFTSPDAVQYWISGFEVTRESPDASRFWPESGDNSAKSFFLPLSRNLNAFIGGRGAGKSAAIEALSFVCNDDEYGTIDLKALPDWYKRAEATLSGCTVRLCFQFLGEDEGTDLPKRALFARRHFSGMEKNASVHFSDLDDHELLPKQVPIQAAQIFRLGQIEQHAGPTRLRLLFDSICGPDVQEVQNQIQVKKKELASQRQIMINLAKGIVSLTAAGTALRDYMHRKELLVIVDRKEIREAYERIDQLTKAQKTASSAKENWDQLEKSFEFEKRKSEIAAFFAKHRTDSKDSNGKILPDHQKLLDIIGTDASYAGGTEHLILETIDTLETRIKSLEVELSSHSIKVGDDAKRERDALQSQGLPLGAKDRELKKKAFEDAEDALIQYRELLAKWYSEESKRKIMALELQNLANIRSGLREKTAKLITERLKRDLDSSILIIEANARTQSDKREFRSWLEFTFSDQAFKYRDKRIAGLIGKGLNPAPIRNILSDVEPTEYSILEVPGGASQGGIDISVAQFLYQKCAMMTKLQPEKQESDTPKEVWKEYPEEIKNGLLDFCHNTSGALCAESVLKLDEILSDDEPVILLNDRPHDPNATLRPLESLSPGQRCSAVLPILLLTGTGPLIIDQPEDNLDNRLIRQVIVNILSSIKLRRQVIVATHNPNVPVLGDVENAVVLRGVGDRECVIDAVGDLDSADVVHQLTQVMEGGREAFQYRQTIYQIHWIDSVAQNEIKVSNQSKIS